MPSEIELLLKEYDSLRIEVIERVKTAFSHLAFFGAVIAFAFQTPDKISINQQTAFWLAVVGSALLLYISIINWCWVSRIASHLQLLECRINKLAGKKILTWEGTVEKISRWVLLPPKKYPGNMNQS